MVNLNIQLKDFTPRHLPQYFGEKFADIPPHPGIQDTAAIFWYPDYVVFCPIRTVPT
jgi:hypothetical protein